jgi:hypothetical protein
VLPEAVRAVIEVKKTLNWNSLDESLANLTETTHLLRKWRNEPNRVFTGIFAFGDELNPASKPIPDRSNLSHEGTRTLTLDACAKLATIASLVIAVVGRGPGCRFERGVDRRPR